MDRPNVRTDNRGRAEMSWTRPDREPTRRGGRGGQVLPAADRSDRVDRTSRHSPAQLDAPIQARRRSGRTSAVDAGARWAVEVPPASCPAPCAHHGRVGRRPGRRNLRPWKVHVPSIGAASRNRGGHRHRDVQDKSVQRTLARTGLRQHRRAAIERRSAEATSDIEQRRQGDRTPRRWVCSRPPMSSSISPPAAGQPDISGRGLTTEAGDATFDWIRPATGVETITVRAWSATGP